MEGPETALQQIAELLRREDTVISSHVVEPSQRPALGPLAASGPRCAADPARYSFIVESIREGFLLHYETPRLLTDHDQDLALLAGDYLYALGLQRLAELRDGDSVRELSDLISICAACQAEGSAAAIPALWLATAVAVGCGGSEVHQAAKDAARSGRAEAADALLESALQAAAAAGLEAELDRAAESIDLAFPRPADRG
jgi:hypothetical protein